MNHLDKKEFSFVDDRYLYLSDYNQVINTCIKELFLEHGANRKVGMQDVDIDEKEIRRRVRKLPQMTFEITENCNLRCKYCVFNGHYRNWRELSRRDMDFETARKGLDYVFSLIKERQKREFAIGFYGGEPLLNTGTMKKIVSYGKELFAGWHLRFNMTTNLTLLDDDMLDFLVENNFILLVSLDGGRENHDAKRVFPDGRGTFDTVYRNLERIAARDRDYFRARVSISAVYSPDLPFKELYEFFSRDELTRKKRIRFTEVSMFDTSYYEDCSCCQETYRRELRSVFSALLDKLRQGKELTGYEDFLYNNFKGIGDCLETRVSTPLGGTCTFDDRLFLDAKGRFHICERINRTFSFGNVDQGFDFEKMAAITREYAGVIKSHCLDCNIRFLCKRCYVYFAGNGRFRIDPEFCGHQRETTIRNLEKYIECKEEGLV